MAVCWSTSESWWLSTTGGGPDVIDLFLQDHCKFIGAWQVLCNQRMDITIAKYRQHASYPQCDDDFGVETFSKLYLLFS